MKTLGRLIVNVKNGIKDFALLHKVEVFKNAEILEFESMNLELG